MIALFFSAFLAATFFPAQSELGLAYLLAQTPEDTAVLIAVASLGNTLGSLVNWAIGRGLLRFSDSAPEKRSKWHRSAQSWYDRYGYWSLLASWMPFIGDPITFVAGLLKEPLWRFVLLVGIAKTVRYLVVAAVTLQVW